MKTCDTIRELLVDYADGVLPPEEHAAVAEHVERCAACAETVRALQASLAAALGVWQGQLAAIEDATANGAPRPQQTRRRSLRLVYWLGSGAAAAALLLVLWWGQGPETHLPPSQTDTGNSGPAVVAATPPSDAVEPGDVSQTTGPVRSTGAPLSAAELEAHIQRQGLAAQLVAAADLLENEPEGREWACERYAYVAAHYRETTAALDATERYAAGCERRTP